MAEQDCTIMEEEYERNVTIELTVGTTYSVASPLANTITVNSGYYAHALIIFIETF